MLLNNDTMCHYFYGKKENSKSVKFQIEKDSSIGAVGPLSNSIKWETND